MRAQDVAWTQVTALHMDEYIGLEQGHEQSFAQWLRDRLPDTINFEAIIPGDNPEAEADRYAGLIAAGPIDLVCLGIGNNGHIAFNEPGCNFDDPKLLRQITFDEASRVQQVSTGCFTTLDEVPAHALTLTVPALLSGTNVIGVVKGAHKAKAAAQMVTDRITTECPATALRSHSNVTMFLDSDAAEELVERRDQLTRVVLHIMPPTRPAAHWLLRPAVRVKARPTKAERDSAEAGPTRQSRSNDNSGQSGGALAL